VKRAIPWPRVLAEGAVIVVSILLAFAIDAWWDDQSARQITREHLEAVRFELLENVEILDDQVVDCAEQRRVTGQLLSLMGPRPGPISSDSLVFLVGGALSGGIARRLSTTALDEMVAQGQLAFIESDRLRQDLGEWRSRTVDRRTQQRENARMQIREAQSYAQTVMPYARVTARDGTVFGVPHTSRFDLDVTRVLSDPTLEGAVSILAEWRNAICRGDAGRRDEADAMVSQIEDELSRGR